MIFFTLWQPFNSLRLKNLALRTKFIPNFFVQRFGGVEYLLHLHTTNDNAMTNTLTQNEIDVLMANDQLESYELRQLEKHGNILRTDRLTALAHEDWASLNDEDETRRAAAREDAEMEAALNHYYA